MIFGLSGKNKKPLLDIESTQWIFDTFEWSLHNFGADVFQDETVLVTPSPEHFPGADNADINLEQLMFSQVVKHAGLSHWPFLLVDGREYVNSPSPAINIQGALRGSSGVAVKTSDNPQKLPVTFDIALLSNPQAIIANFSHILAQYMGMTASSAPPGGEENWSHVTELLAIFMGFGLMFANSANNFKTVSCGSCQVPQSQRAASLSQYDVTYALALFCVLKKIPVKQVLPHLKKSLCTFYKKSVRELESRDEEINRLLAINTPVKQIASSTLLK